MTGGVGGAKGGAGVSVRGSARLGGARRAAAALLFQPVRGALRVRPRAESAISTTGHAGAGSREAAEKADGLTKSRALRAAGAGWPQRGGLSGNGAGRLLGSSGRARGEAGALAAGAQEPGAGWRPGGRGGPGGEEWGEEAGVVYSAAFSERLESGSGERGVGRAQTGFPAGP